MCLITATRCHADGRQIGITADRLTENFAICPAEISTGQGWQMSLESWDLVHLPSGQALFPLSQHEGVGQERRVVALDRAAVERFAQWLESIRMWSQIHDPHTFGQHPLTEKQCKIMRSVVINPNRAGEILDAASREIDDRLQFVPPRRERVYAGSSH